MLTVEYNISPKEHGMMLKTYLLSTLQLSRTQLTSLKKDPMGILIDGEHVTVRHILKEGEILSVATEDEACGDSIVPMELPLSILYEDDDYIVLDKPPHMPTHPSHGHFTDTLANALAWEFVQRRVPFVFRACSRLDRDTSGVVTVAKHRAAAYHFHKLHLSGEVEKEYLAILWGVPAEKEGIISAPIARKEESVILRTVREDGQEAVTRYRVLASGKTPAGEDISIVSAIPVTGRTHQLRVHFAYIGTPIVGDFLYGQEDKPYIDRQALHARRISFVRADGVRVSAIAELPRDMQALLAYMKTEV